MEVKEPIIIAIYKCNGRIHRMLEVKITNILTSMIFLLYRKSKKSIDDRNF